MSVMASERDTQSRETGLFRTLGDFNVDVICNAIQDNKVQLHAVVEELGPLLASTDVLERRQATQSLADMICGLALDFLNMKEVHFLIEFLCNRLQDHHSIVPHVLRGIQKLSQCPNLPEGAAEMIIRTVLKEVHVPSQLYEDRYCVYSIFSVLLKTNLKDIQAIGPEFVYGFIQILDGEKNPCCLLKAFHIIPFITCNIDLGVFVEDLFEVISCYFPVDFSPRANDPSGVTREDLGEALQTCLASTEKFSKYCLPLLLEKMDSDLPSAWLDSWNLLIACCKVYTLESFKPFLSPLWAAVRRQVFLCKSEESTMASLSALTALTQAISPSLSEIEVSSTVGCFLEEIISECKAHLSEPEEESGMLQSSKILHAIAVASPSSCSKVLSFVFPFLVQQFPVYAQANRKKTALVILATFLKVNKEFGIANEGQSHFKNYYESVLSFFYSALSANETEIKLAGLRGLNAAISVSHLLKDWHFDLLTKHLIQLTLTESDNSIRKEAITLVSDLALTQPDIVKEQIITPMFNMLSTRELEDKNIPYNYVIETIAAASSHTKLLTEVAGPLFDILQKQFTNKTDAGNALTLAKCFLSMASYHMSSYCPPISVLHSQFTLPLIKLCLERSNQKCYLFTSEELSAVEIFCRVIHNVVPALDESSASSLIEEVISSCVHLVFATEMDHSLSLYCLTPINVPNECLFVALLVLRSTIGSIPQSISIPKIHELFTLLLTVAINESSDHKVTEVASQCLALIVLKTKNADDLSDLITESSKFLTMLICSNEYALQKEKALLVWAWLTKSLVVQGHIRTTHFIDKMIDWLQDDKLGRLAADGFYTIVQEIPEVITTKNHPNIKLFYRQRFFIETSPKLLKEYYIAPDDQKANYVMALSHQLKFIPKSVLLSELPSLIPLIVQSLHQKNTDLLLSTSTTLLNLLKSDDGCKLLESHISTLLPKLLNLLIEKKSMELRILFLQSLKLIALMPAHLLIPYQQEAICKLGACLDDNKRLVRQNAVQARCQWFLVGHSGS